MTPSLTPNLAAQSRPTPDQGTIADAVGLPGGPDSAVASRDRGLLRYSSTVAELPVLRDGRGRNRWKKKEQLKSQFI